uniref:Uncharacterized protein n=1 Tax=Eutreptiella gymnastica TaxID=73025 RepID=A0A7S4CEQ0_9EUGL
MSPIGVDLLHTYRRPHRHYSGMDSLMPPVRILTTQCFNPRCNSSRKVPFTAHGRQFHCVHQPHIDQADDAWHRKCSNTWMPISAAIGSNPSQEPSGLCPEHTQPHDQCDNVRQRLLTLRPPSLVPMGRHIFW